MGGGVYWWKNYGSGMVEGMKHTAEEGQTYGRDADDAKCLNESLARYKRDAGLTGAISARIFLKSCLEQSGPSAGFCDGVPAKSEFTRTADWRGERCEQAGLGRDQFCPQFFEEVQEYCASSASRNKQQQPTAIPEEEVETPTPTPRRGRGAR